MAGQIKHIFTNPQADVTNTNIVRPSDWNSVHAYTLPDGISAGTQLASSGTIVFANSNGITFGMSQSSQITASHNGLTTAAASDHSHGNPTLALTNLSGTTASASNGFTLSLSVGAGGAGDGVNILAAGTQTANTTGTVLFDNANGLSFGMNNSSVITGSYTVPSVAAYFSKTNTTFNGTNISGSLTLNTDGLQVNLSVGAGGAGDGVNILAAGTQTANTTGTVLFNNANGISFGMSNSSVITASYTVPSTAGLLSAVNVSAGTTSNNLSAMTFANSNGISFGLNGSVVTGTVKTDYLTTAALSNHSHGVSFTSGSVAFQTLSFTNSNGISFNSGTQGIFASHNALTTARASTDAIGLNTAQTNVTWTVNSSGLSLNAAGYAGTGTSATNASITLNSNGLAISVGAGGGVTPVASASNGSFSFTTIGFSNANNVTFGTSAGNIITASVAAPGAAAENNWVNLLGANTAGNTTASGSTIGYSGINLTLSGTNGSVMNISAPATSSLVGTSGISISTNGSTISVMGPANTQRWQWPPGNLTAVAALGNGSFSINRIQPEAQISATRVDVPFLVSLASSATANTWGLAVTVFGAIYTKNASTLSSLSSGSVAWSTSLASNSAGGTQIIAHAIRPLSIPMNVNMSAGEYYVGFGVSTNTSSVGTATTALGNTWSIMGGLIYSSAVGQVGDFTATTNTSTGLFGGQGVYSAAISTVPPTVSLSAINHTGSYYARANMGVIFRNI